MKELGMSWKEIKSTPRHELVGLLGAMSNYNQLHQFDGYTAEEVSKLAKEKPHVRTQYAEAMKLKTQYELRSGKKKATTSFSDLGI
tara:strand:+ start:516 stop:773 length:258 start_codon:yes stop_codon:yes gene_type:complete